MSDSAMVILGNEISNSDLHEFIKSLGGSLVPEEYANFVVSDDDASVWLGIQPRELMSGLYDDETVSEWESTLGGKPISIVELQIGHSDSSYQLYLYIAYKMGERWKLILDDIDDRVLPFNELENKYRENSDRLNIDKK